MKKLETFNSDFIEKEIENNFFSDNISRDIFANWCSSHIGIQPKYIERVEY